MSQVGSATTQPLVARQHEPNHGNNRLTLVLVEALKFLVRTLESELPAVILRAFDDPSAHVAAVSDAPYGAVVPPRLFGPAVAAFIVAFPDGAFGPASTIFASIVVPDEAMTAICALRAQKALIHGLEAIGVAAPYFAPELQARLRGREVLHLADNQPANGAFTRGYSAAPGVARIVSAGHSAQSPGWAFGGGSTTCTRMLTSLTCPRVTVVALSSAAQALCASRLPCRPTLHGIGHRADIGPSLLSSSSVR